MPIKRDTPTLADRATYAAVRALLGATGVLPYAARIGAMGWLTARIAAPLAGWDKRVENNLNLIWPDLPKAEVKRLKRAVPDNVGRSMAETFAGPVFVNRVKDTELTGPGLTALFEAHEQKRPVLLATGHFGNYQAIRAGLIARGLTIGGLYNPMSNPLFHAYYVTAMKAFGGPLFERGRRGLADMMKYVRSGGMVGVVADHHMAHGVPLDFLGQPAWTALSSAEIALKYNAQIIPAYGIRNPDGLSFKLIVEAPIPKGTAHEMTQAMNDSLAALVKQHPEQWFWIHRRWKAPPSAAASAPAAEA